MNTENRAVEIIAREAALFIQKEAGTESLITVIRAQHQSGLGAGRAGAKVIIFVSVYPVEKARAALSFLERQREAFSKHLKAHTHLRLPRVEFLLDNGELNGGPGGIRTLA